MQDSFSRTGFINCSPCQSTLLSGNSETILLAKGRLPVTNYQVFWNGPIMKSSGIGIASREYALALYRQGVDIKVMKGSKLSRSSNLISNRLQTGLSKKPYIPLNPKVLIYHGLPNTLNMEKARKQYDFIMLNTVWETTKIPNNWFPNINRFDAVCVPSAHNKAAMRNSGVRIPVYIVPHGVNTKTFTPKNNKIPLQLAPNTFIFVSIFTFQHRKNPETLLRAYWEEFSSKDRVGLVIKTNGFGSHETGGWIKKRIHAYKKRLGLGSKKTAPLHLITDYTSPQKLKGIYTAGHAFVLPTRGEGVGLPFLEALSSGVPVIATRWGGQMDFLNSRNSFLIPYKLKPPSNSMKRSISRSFSYLFAQKGQLWAEPNLNNLKQQMRFAYKHPEVCRSKGQQGRQDMHKQSWNRAGIAMKHAIEKVIRSTKRSVRK
jgi:glycosyltransferase involved in cell wall biosynthesis